MPRKKKCGEVMSDVPMPASDIQYFYNLICNF